jgi:hypothetical protein
MTTATTSSGREKLIQEGAASFVQATIAMKEFVRIVQDECESLALRNLNEINRVMGTELSEEDLRRARKGSFLDPNDPWLYVYLALGDDRYISIGLYWESVSGGGYQLHAITTFSVSAAERGLCQRALERFRKLRKPTLGTFPYRGEDRHITLHKPIPAEEAALFPRSIEFVLTGFLEEWEKIGGLKGVSGGPSKAAGK